MTAVGETGGESDRELQPIVALVVEPPVAPDPMPDVLEWIARRYVAPLGRVFERCTPPRVRVRIPAPIIRSAAPTPTSPDQLLPYSAGAALLRALVAGESGTWCLRPAPGADRGTLIGELVAASRGQSLVAVPEVAYGSRVLEQLGRTHELARVDSALAPGARSEAWLRLASGHYLGAGGRGVLFAPAPELRLVVVDEEHHRSYKEERAPRFDARRLAVERARAQGALCVLISPTPTLETARDVLAHKTNLVEPGLEAERSQRPLVEVIAPDERLTISAALHQRIAASLKKKQRVALLSPRSGFARAVWCLECRRSLRCPRCERGLAFDRASNAVRCVRCGYTDSLPDVCPSCGARKWRYIGAGSERLAQQLAAAFPRARTALSGPDRAAGIPQQAAIPEETDIYVTTWFGTKETLRPPAELVVVLDADWLLRRPDFRAGERAHQAFAEMAAWAGSAGRLVIETADTRHPAVQAIVRSDYWYFVRHELAARAELSYPPHSELIAITAIGPEAESLAEQAAAACRDVGTVLGPMPVHAARDPGVELLVKTPDAVEVADVLRDILPRVAPPNRLRVDVDPR